MAVKDGFRPGHLGVTLFVRNAKDAADFYRKALGAQIIYEHRPDDGTTTGFDLRVGDTFFVVATANPKQEAYERHGN